MKASTGCDFSTCIDVFLNGRHLKDCFYADDVSGEVWVSWRNARNQIVHDFDAPKGAFVYEGLQVIKLKGDVKIKVTPPDGVTEKECRAAIHDTSSLPEVVRVE